MILQRQLMLSAAALAASSHFCLADSLSLSKKERWLVVASTRDVDSAIGIAGLYADEEPRVVSARNGWFAVVMGPYRVRSVRDIQDRFVSLPKDALLSRGASYEETVWSSKPAAQVQLDIVEAGRLKVFNLGKLVVSVAMHQGEDGLAGPSVITGSQDGKQVFKLTAGEAGDAVNIAQAGVVRLDPETDDPQFVFTRYSGGAHCCVRTYIATKPKGATDWALVDAGELDGEGYAFIDLDYDGVSELAQIDNNFLYSFDSYANSFAPAIYRQLKGTGLKNISDLPLAEHALKQDIAGLEFNTKLDGATWKSNGFLAAWVASKVRLGEGEEAWATMLENFDRNSDFNQRQCLTQQDEEACPESLVRDIPFPQALARFLEVSGYGPLPDSAVRSLE